MSHKAASGARNLAFSKSARLSPRASRVILFEPKSIIFHTHHKGLASDLLKGNVYKGRKPTIEVDEVRRLKEEGLGATEIAKRLSIVRSSVYRVLAEAS
jgi:DNA invertase Pin-like site-specific DNA recombinase